MPAGYGNDNDDNSYNENVDSTDFTTATTRADDRGKLRPLSLNSCSH